MRILIDTSIRQHANAFSGEWRSTGTQLWGGKIPVKTGGITTVFSGHKIGEHKGGDQNGALGALARAFMEGNLTAATTDVLEIERFNKPGTKFFAGQLGSLNLFSKVTYEHFVTLPNFSFLISFFSQNQEPILALRQCLDRQHLPAYVAIRKALDQVKKSQKNSQDAWHLHCCTSLGLDAFLTTDTKLVGQIKSIQDKTMRHDLLKYVRLPTDLAADLDIAPMTSVELSELAVKLGAFQIFGRPEITH